MSKNEGDKTFRKIEEIRLSGGYGMCDDNEQLPFWMFIIGPVIAYWKHILIVLLAVIAIIVVIHCR